MPQCPECGHDLPEGERPRVFEGLGLELPPTLAEIVDAVGYGG